MTKKPAGKSGNTCRAVSPARSGRGTPKAAKRLIGGPLRFVVTEPQVLSAEVRKTLECAGTVRYGPFATRDRLIDNIADAQILMVRLKHRIDRDVLDAAPDVKMIISATTGVNHLDLEACAERGIDIICLRGEQALLSRITSTAELSFSLLMALARRIPAAHEHVKAGNWDRDSYFGLSLSGMTLGIIGLGRLGSLMAGYAKAFSMRVIAHDTAAVPMPASVDTLIDKKTLLAMSDAIAIHASHLPGEPVVIGANELDTMKRGALLVNTARGELVDENAICRALEKSQLGGYAADVLSGEQSVGICEDHPLIATARRGYNVILTPHIGGATENGLAQAERFVVQKAMTALAMWKTV